MTAASLCHSDKLRNNTFIKLTKVSTKTAPNLHNLKFMYARVCQLLIYIVKT